MDSFERQVRVATSAEEREAIYRFRYQTYVVEQGKQPPGADHDRQWLTDGLDEDATLVYVQRDDEVSGTVRLNQWTSQAVPAELQEEYDLARFRDFSQASWTFSSYFMVAQQLRGTTVMPRLFCGAYDVSLELGMRFNFCLAAPRLVGVYSQLGYRRYKPNVVTDSVGLRVPMVLVAEDVKHLEAVRSPCAKLARTKTDSDETARWFAGEFPSELGRYDERLNRRQFLDELAGLYQLQNAPLFAGLSEAEIEDVIAESTLVRCQPGERVLRRGDPGGELFLIVEGKAQRSAESLANRACLGPGDFFGEIAFLTQSLRNDNVQAKTRLSLLVFTRSQILRLMKRDPNAAATLNANIATQLALRLRGVSAATTTPASVDGESTPASTGPLAVS